MVSLPSHVSQCNSLVLFQSFVVPSTSSAYLVARNSCFIRSSFIACQPEASPKSVPENIFSTMASAAGHGCYYPHDCDTVNEWRLAQQSSGPHSLLVQHERLTLSYCCLLWCCASMTKRQGSRVIKSLNDIGISGSKRVHPSRDHWSYVTTNTLKISYNWLLAPGGH